MTTRGPSEWSACSSSSALAGSTKPPITWPPSNPTSTRTRSASANGHHLREDSVDGLGMHEGHLQPEHAAPRLRVDQLHAFLRKRRERGRHVVDLVRDVVHARPALREQAAHRRVVAERGAQLDPAFAEPKRGLFDDLVLAPFAMLAPTPEQPLVRP